MAKIIENMTGTDVVIADLGITVVASGTYGLTNKSVSAIANSDDLITLLSSGTLKLQKTASPLVYYTVANAIKVLTLIPFTPALDSNGYQVVDTPGKNHIDGRTSIHQSSRPIGTSTYFTGYGDDRSNPQDVGSGIQFHTKHNIGDPINQSLYVDFNISNNKTYLHEAYIMYKACEFDMISACIVPEVTAYTAGTNTFYNLVNGYLIVPAAGDGLINITMPKLIYMPLDQSGQRTPSFWNATWNSITNSYDNITAAPLGDGEYNMFSAEIKLTRFLNGIQMLGDTSSPFMLQSSDSQEIGDGMRMLLETTTSGTDHPWELSFLLTMHRKKTV